MHIPSQSQVPNISEQARIPKPCPNSLLGLFECLISVADGLSTMSDQLGGGIEMLVYEKKRSLGGSRGLIVNLAKPLISLVILVSKQPHRLHFGGALANCMPPRTYVDRCQGRITRYVSSIGMTYILKDFDEYFSAQ